MNNDLLAHLNEVHTTELGTVRVKRNLDLKVDDVVEWCKEKIKESDRIVRKGKNWYIEIDDALITVNAYSYTIITAHKI